MRVGLGRPDRGLDHPHPGGLDNPVGRTRGLGIVIVDQDALAGSVQLPHQVASLLGVTLGVLVRGVSTAGSRRVQH